MLGDQLVVPVDLDRRRIEFGQARAKNSISEFSQRSRSLRRSSADKSAGSLFRDAAGDKLVNEFFLEVLFPRTEKQKKLDQEPERWARVRAVLENENVTPPATRNTLWGLYNAVVRAEDYRDARQNESARLERVWFGSGHDLEVKALDLARRQLKKAA